MKHIAKLKQLEELDLRMTYVTGEGIKPLADLPRLKKLDIRNSRYIDNAAVRHCRTMPALESLRLPPLVNDKGLAMLGEFKRLKYLDISQCQVSKEAVDALRKKLPNCTIVSE